MLPKKKNHKKNSFTTTTKISWHLFFTSYNIFYQTKKLTQIVTTQKLKMGQLKTQFVTTQNSNCDELITQIMTNQNCEKTQKIKYWQNLKKPKLWQTQKLKLKLK